MSGKVKNKDVKAIARQFVLSGLSGIMEPREIYSDGSTQQLGRKENDTKGPDWQQKTYQATVSFIIEETGLAGDKHEYRVRLNDDAHLLVTTYSARSKKATSPTVAIPQKKGKDTTLALVYGVHKEGPGTLAHPTGQEGIRIAANIYSFLLGQIDNAIQYRLHQLKGQETTDDTGERYSSSLLRKDVGGHKKTGGGKEIRPKVLSEALPETTPILVEAIGALLGDGHPDYQDRIKRVGDDNFIGTGLEDFTPEF